uniref:Uncharacterized protein n=1 Tax=Triticum urartu TaxID=4572 RepID=A0A8R7TZ16_TRIUA
MTPCPPWLAAGAEKEVACPAWMGRRRRLGGGGSLLELTRNLSLLELTRMDLTSCRLHMPPTLSFHWQSSCF